MPKIVVENENLTFDFNPAVSILNNFHRNGTPLNSLCGGRGNCGACRIQILDGQKFTTPLNEVEKFKLNEDEIQQGWRLGCQVYALRDITINLPD